MGISLVQKYQNRYVNIWNTILLTQIVRSSYTDCPLQKCFQTNWKLNTSLMQGRFFGYQCTKNVQDRPYNFSVKKTSKDCKCLLFTLVMTITTIVLLLFYYSTRWFMGQQGKDLIYTWSTRLIIPSHSSDTNSTNSAC